MKKITFLALVSIFAFLISCSGDDPAIPIVLEDIEGNVYETIQIGDQIWMAENLKTTKYSDGSSIESGADDNWSMSEGRYQWASTEDLNNAADEELSFDHYGVIYNSVAIKTGLAPEGWRIPTESDWNKLIAFVQENGYTNKEGQALKSTTGWSGSENGDDAFGFNALPGGYVDTFGTPKADGVIGNWASSTQNSEFTYSVASVLDADKVLVSDESLWFGTSVRLIKE